MIALYIVGGLLLLIALLLSSPVSVNFFYRQQPQMTAYVWGRPIALLPRKKTKPKPKTTPATAKSKTRKEKKTRPSLLQEIQSSFEQDGVAATLRWLGELSGVLGRNAGGLARAITVKDLRIEMRIAGTDAAQAAIRYGEVCAVFYPAYALVTSGLTVKKQTVDIRADFKEEGGAVLVDMTARISLWRLAGAFIALGWSMLCMQIKSYGR